MIIEVIILAVIGVIVLGVLLKQFQRMANNRCPISGDALISLGSCDKGLRDRIRNQMQEAGLDYADKHILIAEKSGYVWFGLNQGSHPVQYLQASNHRHHPLPTQARDMTMIRCPGCRMYCECKHIDVGFECAECPCAWVWEDYGDFRMLTPYRQ